MMYETLDHWIRQEAIPFSGGAAEKAAIDKLVAALGDKVELLGFGEALHGGEDILMFRNRLFQHLVEKHGYSAIAVESSFPKGFSANDYVLGRGDAASYDDVKDSGFSHNFGHIEANGELIEWMRQYNADAAHTVKVQFYGFDSPTESIGTDSPSQVLHVALDYLAAIDGDEKRRERIDALIGSDADWENPDVSMNPSLGIGLSEAATALRIETEDLITELQIRRPELVAKSGKARYWKALHYAVIARQLLNYHAKLARQFDNRLAELLGIRDVMMADNLDYIVQRERGRGKVLAFAHNSHLRYGSVEWQLGMNRILWWSAGAHLKEMLGARYCVIGSAVGVSEANGISQPEANTLEARLMALDGTGAFIPTHQGEGLPAAEIAALPTRSGGGVNPSYTTLNARSFNDFDWLAMLDTTTYMRGGPKLQKYTVTSKVT